MSLDAPAQAAKAMAETRQQPPPTARARDATDRTCGSLRLCNRRVSTRRAASRARNLPRGCARRRPRAHRTGTVTSYRVLTRGVDATDNWTIATALREAGSDTVRWLVPSAQVCLRVWMLTCLPRR
jgi:hypothetical protein